MLLSLIGIVAAVISYRITFPPISKTARILLAALRGLMIFLLGLLLMEPVMNIFSSTRVEPALAVLFDDSGSMGLSAEGGSRIQLADSLAGNALAELRDEKRIFAFSSDLRELKSPPSAIDSAGNATSIAGALEELSAREDAGDYGAVLLVTDGRQNLGEDPVAAAMKLDMPVYTLTVGEKAEQANVAITDVTAPALAYSGDKFNVDVQIEAEGEGNARSKAFLKLNGKVVAEKLFDLPGGGRKTTVEFEAEAPSPGRYNYKVSTPVLERDEPVDNERTFSVNVLKNKIKVLLTSDALDWEFKYTRRFLVENSEFDVDAVYPSGMGRFSEPGPPLTADDLAKYDLVVLINCRPEDVRIARSNLEKFVEKGGAVVYVAGSDCPADIGGFDGLLPFESTSTGNSKISQGEFLFEPSPVYKQHAAILVKDNPEESARIWHSLPPFGAVITGLKPTGEVILETRSAFRDQNPLPVLTVDDKGKGRVAAITGFPLWRSYFGAAKGSDTAIPLFWKNLARWATARHEGGNFEIFTDRAVYRLGEPIKMTGYLYDEANRPKGGALVAVSITPEGDQKPIKDVVLTQSGSGIYGGDVLSLAPGSYTFRSTASSYGDTLGTTSGKFTIEKYSLEVASGAPDYSLTRRISEATGGKAYTSADFADFTSDLKLTPFEREEHARVKPFGMPLFLVIVLAGLCIEWGMRKRMRLP